MNNITIVIEQSHPNGNVMVWYALGDDDIIDVGHTKSDNDTYETWTHEEASDCWGDEPLPEDMQALFDAGHKEIVCVSDHGADIVTYHAPNDPDLISELDWAKDQIADDLQSCKFLSAVDAFEYVNRNGYRSDLVNDALKELVNQGELGAGQIIQNFPRELGFQEIDPETFDAALDHHDGDIKKALITSKKCESIFGSIEEYAQSLIDNHLDTIRASLVKDSLAAELFDELEHAINVNDYVDHLDETKLILNLRNGTVAIFPSEEK